MSLPQVTHNSTSRAPVAFAHATTCSTNCFPNPVPRASGATHIDVRWTVPGGANKPDAVGASGADRDADPLTSGIRHEHGPVFPLRPGRREFLPVSRGPFGIDRKGGPERALGDSDKARRRMSRRRSASPRWIPPDLAWHAAILPDKHLAAQPVFASDGSGLRVLLSRAKVAR